MEMYLVLNEDKPNCKSTILNQDFFFNTLQSCLSKTLMMFSFFCKDLLIYLKGKVTERERERVSYLPPAGLLPKQCKQPGLVQSEHRSQCLHSGLPHEGQTTQQAFFCRFCRDFSRKLTWLYHNGCSCDEIFWKCVHTS